MGIIWADGFGHYGTTEIMVEQSGYLFLEGLTLQTAYARTGPCSLRFIPSGGTPHQVDKAIDGNPDTLGFGIAFYMDAMPDHDYIGFAFKDGAGAVQMLATITPQGTVKFYRGDKVTFLGESGPCVYPNSYYYIKLQCIVSNGSGFFEVSINGDQVILYQGDTQQQATDEIGYVSFGRWNLGYLVEFTVRAYADFVIWNEIVLDPSVYSDCRCRTLLPKANGNEQDWTVEGGGTAWEAISYVPRDASEHSIRSDAAGQISTFAFDKLPTNNVGVQSLFVVASLSKSDIGDCEVDLFLEYQGDESDRTTIQPVLSDTYMFANFELAPDGNIWNKERADQIRIGLERIL